MKIEALIGKLQALAVEHPDVEVVVGMDHREVCEHEIEDAAFEEAIPDFDCEDRIVLWALV